MVVKEKFVEVQEHYKVLKTENNTIHPDYDFIKNLTGFLQIPFFYTALIIGFMLLFGLVFYMANISTNGLSKQTLFTGYCMWVWIILLSVVLLINYLLSYFRPE
jgi:hypothetical protein